MVLVAIPFGLAIGIALGMLGGGGSVLAVPVLVYVLGQSVHQATTASLVVVTAGALAGGLGHARESHVCWRHAGGFVLAAIPGIVAGTALGNAVSGSTLIAAFAVIMLIAAAATWRKASQRTEDRVRQQPACPPLRQSRTLAAGLLIGAADRLLRRRRRVPDRPDAHGLPRSVDAPRDRDLAGDHHRDIRACADHAPAHRTRPRDPRHRSR